MALLFCDGFDHYATADITKKWTYLATEKVKIKSGEGRSGSNALQVYGDSHEGGAGIVYKTLDAIYQTLCFGFGLKLAQLTTNVIFSLKEDSLVHLDFYCDANGRLIVKRGETVLGTTGPVIFVPAVYMHLQVKVYIHDTLGTIDILANGKSVLSLTDLDTNNGGTGINTFYCAAKGWTYDSYHFDDFWIDDAELLGDCKIETLFPTAAGATTAWTPSAGDNYACVDEVAPNSDTDYISSETINQVDTYVFENLEATAGSIKGVQVSVFAKIDDVGSKDIALVARPVATDRLGDNKSVNSVYTYHSQIWSVNPEDSEPWEVADINGSEFGVKLVS